MKELLFSITKKDFDINYFSGTGAGGQYRNKHQNCVRLRHKASGALVTGQSHRNRAANTKEAFANLVKSPLFIAWHSRMIYEVMSGKTIDERVNEMMERKNLHIEIIENERWVDQTWKSERR